ncbi:hypothetical protein GCM10010402_76600 [Actinomadura luteofluorescens]|uniref:hypothetical protein n=2 Tax=Actinomadura luteofluorescens TaxID=46163 RepID=UPI0030CDC6D8|nr:hypothetical protein [Actinomadura glauciflava]
MTAHLNDSDRQALRLAQDLREEMRAALPQAPTPPSVSPFVDQTGMPSVLLRMDAETARALMAVLAERRGAAAEQRRADGSHVPPPVPPPVAQAVPAAQGPVVAGLPYGEPAYGQQPLYTENPYTETTYVDSPYAEAPYIPPQPSPAGFTGGTGPTPLVPSVYPTH